MHGNRTETKRIVIRGVINGFDVGKTKIRVSVDGCVICGTEYSTRWFEAGTVILWAGKKEHQVTVSRCADCEAIKSPGLFD